MTRGALPFICLLMFSCSSGMRLSDAERAKLDPSLHRLLTGERVVESDYDSTIRPDGQKEYAIVAMAANVDEIKKAGITVSSVFGDVVTVRVTKEELQTLLSLASVRSLSNGSKNIPH